MVLGCSSTCSFPYAAHVIVPQLPPPDEAARVGILVLDQHSLSAVSLTMQLSDLQLSNYTNILWWAAQPVGPPGGVKRPSGATLMPGESSNTFDPSKSQDDSTTQMNLLSVRQVRMHLCTICPQHGHAAAHICDPADPLDASLQAAACTRPTPPCGAARSRAWWSWATLPATPAADLSG